MINRLLSWFLKTIPFTAASVGQVDAFEHEGQLRQTQSIRDNTGVCLNGKPKRACFQTLVVKTIAAAVPEENFYPVPVAVEKNEQMAGQRVLPDDG